MVSLLREAIRHALDVGVASLPDARDARHLRATNATALVTTVAVALRGLGAAAIGDGPTVVESAVFAVVMPTAAWATARRGRTVLAGTAVSGLFLLQLLWPLYWFGYDAHSWLLFIPMIAVGYFVFPRRARAGAHAVVSFSVGSLLLATAFQEHLPPRAVIPSLAAEQAANLVLLCVAFAVFVALAVRAIDTNEDALDQARARSDHLLDTVLPASVAARLKEDPGAFIADRYPEVTVLFADIVGFTPLSERLTPARTVELLDEVFTAFDAICDKHGVEKVRTIGDGYMAVAGAPEEREDHALAMARVAMDLRDYMAGDRTGEPLRIRIGLNSGETVAGVVGTTRFHFDLWGDVVNVAARMESLGEPGRVHMAEPTWRRIREKIPSEERGTIEVKGKGPMTTYWIV